MRSAWGLALAAGVLAALAQAVELAEDKPPVPPPKAGALSGRIAAPAPLENLQAVFRATGKIYWPASQDGKGNFTFRDLPGDASYDLVFETGGRRIEGIDLEFVDARLIRLAEERRKVLGLPPERRLSFTADEAKEILDFAAGLEDFTDIHRVLYLRGFGRRATMLVELMRAREFYAQKEGEVIWRVELWYFENQFGGWERTPNQEKVLRRERIPEPQWRQISVEYYPELSGYIRPDGSSQPVEFEVPKAPDPSRGRIPNTPPEIKTEPHILGLEGEPASQPGASTQPATTRPADASE